MDDIGAMDEYGTFNLVSYPAQAINCNLAGAVIIARKILVSVEPN